MWTARWNILIVRDHFFLRNPLQLLDSWFSCAYNATREKLNRWIYETINSVCKTSAIFTIYHTTHCCCCVAGVGRSHAIVVFCQISVDVNCSSSSASLPTLSLGRLLSSSLNLNIAQIDQTKAIFQLSANESVNKDLKQTLADEGEKLIEQFWLAIECFFKQKSSSKFFCQT